MTTALPAAERHPRQRSVLSQLRVDTGYCLLGLPLSIASFVVVLAMFCVGVGTAVTMGGIFVLIAGMFVARAFANVERRLINKVLRRPVTFPRYKDRSKRTGLRRALVPLTEGQSWADMLWAVFTFVPALAAFVVTVVWWAVGVGYTLNFAWEWAVLPYEQGLSDLMGFSHTYGHVVAVNTVVGLLFLVSTPLVVRGMALTRAGFGRMLLTRERVTALQERVEELTESREAARSAEASALRRLERDIHDGPQQRLVRLTMDLSLAQRRMRTDPDAAAPLLAEAIEQTRETLDELRALSRGIAPPILADRGLAAALAAVTGRCTVPTELDVELPSADRLSATVENTAYFLVAEALTNVAKHSRATWCRVRVTGDGSVVYVTISDNGMGGAHTAKGHGLAGLADRVRAADGRFDLDSPEGGPTVLTAELPCGS
ncbi:MAG TPA: sensor histidine kinase [Actinocatenispora sp.]